MLPASSHRCAYNAVRVGVGLLLLAAAVMKAHQLATEPTEEKTLLTSRWFLTIWVETEFVLAGWLLSGLWMRLGWVAVLGCFVVFLMMTAGKALAGEESCGCFGRIRIDPRYTTVLDLMVVAALAVFRPSLRRSLPIGRRRLRLVLAACGIVGFGVPAGLSAVLYTPASLSTDGEIVGDARFVVLRPEDWTGKRLPLLMYIDISDRISRGTWTLVLYHYDCPHCKAKLPEYERQAREESLRKGITSVAMIELPPYAPPGLSPLPPSGPYVRGAVSNVRDWFVETPTVVVIKDGVVVRGVLDAEPTPDVKALAAIPPARDESPTKIADGQYDFGYVEPKSGYRLLLAIPHPFAKSTPVEAVRSECKCMIGQPVTRVAVKGEPILVRLIFVAPDQPMVYNKRLVLQMGSAIDAVIPIAIKADVGIALVAEPSPLDFGRLARGERRERTATIRNRSKTPVHLVYSTCLVEGCFVRVPREPLPPMGCLGVPVVVTGHGAGIQKLTVQIQTDTLLQPVVNVPVQMETDTATSGSAASRDRSE
jgi:hypothetical protein